MSLHAQPRFQLPAADTAFGRKIAHLLTRRWRCPGCGAEVRCARDLSGGSWRVGEHSFEHACSPLHRYSGHVVARWLP